MLFFLHPFVCRGCLEVLTTGNEPASFDGIQAHLSVSASPKVLEVATKFPCRVQLEEVCSIHSWPLQFLGVNPDEHNIALFFFAKDIDRFVYHTLFYLLIACWLVHIILCS